MKRSRFTETQIVKILKEAEAGVAVEELSRHHGFSKAVLVFAGVVLINRFAENVVKPKYMGEGLNRSPFMVVFSVIFWAAVLGPLGSILGVPMTLLFKQVVLEADDQNRWIARLMSSTRSKKSPPENNYEEDSQP